VRPHLGPITRHPQPTGLEREQATAGPGRVLIDNTPRSSRYLSALAKLDASANITAAELQRIVDDIHREFAERWAAQPLGIVATCYLGPPFEVHTLAPDGGIVEHYRAGQPLPGVLERARALGMSETYLAVEVYADRMVCLRTDGSTVTIGGGSHA
jgi:hypothetical protein